MKEAFEKIKERLEQESNFFGGKPMGTLQKAYYCNGVERAIEIVNQVAEEYNKEYNKKHNKEYNTDVPDRNVGGNDGWIPCSGCKDCQHKECEHHGKI